MTAEPDDWRRMGQEQDLPPGTTLAFTRYRARGETSEHEHCLFCFAKFMDPDFSATHARFIEENDDVLVEGYTTTAEHPWGSGALWVCPPCLDDFAAEFGWSIEEGPGQRDGSTH